MGHDQSRLVLDTDLGFAFLRLRFALLGEIYIQLSFMQMHDDCINLCFLLNFSSAKNSINAFKHRFGPIDLQQCQKYVRREQKCNR